MRNALAHANKNGRRVVSAFIATAFAQTTADAAGKQWRHVADQLRAKLPKLAALLDEAEVDVLAFMTFPKEHWGAWRNAPTFKIHRATISRFISRARADQNFGLTALAQGSGKIR
jgi:transposase-like protein